MTDAFYSSSLRPVFAGVVCRNAAQELAIDMRMAALLAGFSEFQEVTTVDGIALVHSFDLAVRQVGLGAGFDRAAKGFDHITEC